MHKSMRWVALFSAVGVLALAACDGGGEMAEEDAAPPEEPAAEEPMAEPEGAPQISAEQLPEGVTMAMVEQGQEIFTGNGNCYTCHGTDAMGTQLAPNLTDDEWINIDGEYESIVDLVINGVPQPVQHPSPMPPMGGAQLSDEQVRAVSAYVYAIADGGS